MNETSSSLRLERLLSLAAPYAVFAVTLAAFGWNAPLKIKSFLKYARSPETSLAVNAHGFSPITTGYPVGGGSMVELRSSLIR